MPPLSRPRLAGALVAWALGVLLHEPVQVVFRWGAERWGVAGLEARELFMYALVGPPALVVCGVTAAARRGPRGLAAWIGWTVLVALAWATLTQTRAEAVHLPQYALVAWLLGRAGLDDARAAWLAAGLGALDELFQAVALYPDRAMDWNDAVLNTLGAAAGALARWTWR